jgi:molybdate transport system substrate-binding protein
MPSTPPRHAVLFGAVGLALALGGRAARAEDVLVSAAASLTDALREVAAAHQKATGDRILLNLGASSTLARQIREGAPADLFLSADEKQMDVLDKAGLIVPGTRKRVLSNTLVVVVPADNAQKISTEEDLTRASVGIVAIAEPESVPVGVYARTYFERVGLWGMIAPKVLPTENVRATLAAVESGNVDAGIVYRSDAAISKKVRVAFEIPASRGPAISYPFALVKGAPHEAAGRRLLAYLSGPAARAVFTKFGFTSVP